MNLIDTHTHIYLPEFDADREEVIARAIEEGVSRMILPAVDPSSLPAMKALKESRPDLVSLAAGLHPTDLGPEPDEALAIVKSELEAGGYVAVGEIGLDLYWDKSTLDAQMRAFDRQMRLAARLALPVIIHCREALDPALEVIEGLDRVPQGVFHSFSGTAQEVDRIRSRGDFYFGINGVATFKNCHVADALPEITPERLLLETDAPYLAPVPKRGRRNEPAYIAHTCRFLADAAGMSADEMADATSRNAVRLFGL